MKKINVIVRDKNTLVLEENGEKGDYIDLSTLNNVDFSQIEEIIEQGKDITYQKKISEALTSLENQKDLEIAKLKSDNENALKLLKSDLETAHSEKIHQLTDDKTKQINELKEKISISEKTYNANLESEKQKLINEYQNKLNQQKNEYELQINTLNSQIKSLESNADIKLENEKNKLAAQYENTISNFPKQNHYECKNFTQIRANLGNAAVCGCRHSGSTQSRLVGSRMGKCGQGGHKQVGRPSAPHDHRRR